MNFNVVVFSGRLVADPEIKELGGTTLGKARLINNRVYYKGKGEDREKCEEVTAVDIVAWGSTAKALSYMAKGDICGVEGRIKVEKWESDGNKRSRTVIDVTGIQFGPKKGEGVKSSDPKKEEPEQNDGPTEELGEEDVPF